MRGTNRENNRVCYEESAEQMEKNLSHSKLEYSKVLHSQLN
jgi:hypothetical protein